MPYINIFPTTLERRDLVKKVGSSVSKAVEAIVPSQREEERPSRRESQRGREDVYRPGAPAPDTAAALPCAAVLQPVASAGWAQWARFLLRPPLPLASQQQGSTRPLPCVSTRLRR